MKNPYCEIYGWKENRERAENTVYPKVEERSQMREKA